MAEHEYKPTEVERERLEEAAERLRHSGYGHLSAAVERATESLTHMLDGLRAEARAEALADLHAREDLVEIVAKAMHESMDEGLEWELLHERVRSVYRNHARAVLTAVAHSLGGSRPERIAATYDEPYELIRLEDAISNIDYPGADSEEWTYKAKVAARELMKAVRADERAPFQLILAMPAPGWFTFGSHADQPDLELEFWGAETSLDGLPIWERPAAPSEEVVDAAARALDRNGLTVHYGPASTLTRGIEVVVDAVGTHSGLRPMPAPAPAPRAVEAAARAINPQAWSIYDRAQAIDPNDPANNELVQHTLETARLALDAATKAETHDV